MIKEKLRQKIEKELEVAFEPIFSYEDDTIAAFLPLEGVIQWKMDVWCEHIYKKFRQLSKYFRDCGLPFIDIEQFTKLALIHTMEHEVIHSVDNVDQVSEAHMQYITNKLFVERLIQAILRATCTKITSKLPQIKLEERKQDLELMLSQKKWRNV